MTTRPNIRAIIVDDEEKGRKLLSNLIDKYCENVEVSEMVDCVASGVKAIRKHKPDLVFLDIVMPNESGFELLEKVDTANLEVIFTTAYDQYAIRAIRACALDYLLKPIDFQELQSAVESARTKIVERRTGGLSDERLATFLQNKKGSAGLPQKIGFQTSNGVRFYEIDDIHVCKAEGNYTTVYFDGKEKLELVSKTLKEFEEILSDYNFIRTHRSYLVNLNHISEYRRFNPPSSVDGEGGCVIIANRMKVPVSRDKRKALLERISKPF